MDLASSDPFWICRSLLLLQLVVRRWAINFSWVVHFIGMCFILRGDPAGWQLDPVSGSSLSFEALLPSTRDDDRRVRHRLCRRLLDDRTVADGCGYHARRAPDLVVG